jgi:hypothetical protein
LSVKQSEHTHIYFVSIQFSVGLVCGITKTIKIVTPKIIESTPYKDVIIMKNFEVLGEL